MIFTPHLDCAELAAAVTDYLESALPRRRVRAFERHLEGCVDCDNYLRQMRQTIELTGRLVGEDIEQVPPEVRRQLWEAFKAALPPAAGAGHDG